MGRGKKIRRIDYSRKELMEMCHINNRQSFVNSMTRFCELYGFDVEEFKMDNEKNEDYHFSAEYAELLAIILKNIDKSPLYRKNTLKEQINAGKFEDFYKSLDEDIENEVDENFKNLVLTLPAHLEMKKIKDYIPVFIERLATFIENATTLNNQELGSTLEWICRKLDEANYNLFQSYYLINKVNTSNQESIKSEFKEIYSLLHGDDTDNEQDFLEEKLQDPNVSIDYALSLLIKRIMINTRSLNSKDRLSENGIEFLNNEDNKWLPYLGITIDEQKDGSSLDLLLERTLFYETVVKKLVNPNLLVQARDILDVYHAGKIETSKSIVDKIKEGQFTHKKITLEDKKIHLQNQLAQINEELKEVEKELARSSQGSGNIDNEPSLIEEVNKAYVQHYEQDKESNEDLRKIIDNFLGQVLLNGYTSR